jgi:starch phosphorylase
MGKAERNPDAAQVARLRSLIDERLLCSVATDPATAAPADQFLAVAELVRERLAARWVATQRLETAHKTRRIYYLSMEFLIGRTLDNALSALDLRETAAAALAAQGRQLDVVLACEPDAALGNGGLGRLAACFLDALATCELPSRGYGMRYEYGMFAQDIVNGHQVEQPDPWLVNGSPWEFPRPDIHYTVRYGGTVEHFGEWSEWHPTRAVEAKAFDYVIPGHGTERVSTLRLWKAAAPTHIDLSAFNDGDYSRAAELKNHYEHISWVLYPNDSTLAGRELRLRQEYFFVAASLQDILAQHLAEHGRLDNLAEQVAIHLNDTHPAIAVAELMRLLLDEHGVGWAAAWAQCRRIFSYTNHTLMPEALESWPLAVMQAVAPRHMRIIYRINQEFLDEVAARFPDDVALLRRVSLIDEEGERRVRMAYLCVLASHRVNGVSKLHSELMVHTIFADFARLYPERFHNKTNGVTQRRWLAQANPPLAQLIDERIGRDWRLDLDRLQELRSAADDGAFRAAFAVAKRDNKCRLAEHIRHSLDVAVDPDCLFDVQVKRFHEYKRQLLNVLHVVTRYNALRHAPGADWAPRCVIFAGKAAAGYHMAKQVIRLIHDVAAVINHDPSTRDFLKLVFLPDYGVSRAELIMPAADLSEQISTAGTEASGTGNMKLALNGALTIGTEDGANIEIRDQVGADNIFIFGHSADEVAALRRAGYDPTHHYEGDPALREALDQIRRGMFSPDDPTRYRDVFDSLVRFGDRFMLLADYADYIATQRRVDALYLDPDAWQRKAILNVAGMGPFSADRAIREYAADTWKVAPLPA